MSDRDLRELERRASQGPQDCARYAAALLREGRVDAALEALLVAWRATRDAGLADLVDEVSRRLPANAALSSHESWLAAAGGTPSAAALPALLESLAKGTHPQVAERLDALDAWPDDPRVARALAALVDAVPFHATSSQKAWRRIFARLVREKDGRALAALERAARGPSAITGPAMARWFAAESAKALGKLREAAPSAESAADVAGAFRGATPEPAKGAAALLERVVADPSSEEARVAYGEALAREGDPRGELILLQVKRKRGGLDRKEGKREKELLKAHARSWAGPLAPVIVLGGSSFEGGFLSQVKLKALSERAAAELTGDPIWATVETLAVEGADVKALAQLVAHPVLRSLRTLICPSGALLEALPPLGITGLECDRVDPAEPAFLEAVAALPRLERLSIPGWGTGERRDGLWPDDVKGFLGTKAFARLQLFQLNGFTRSPDAWLAALGRTNVATFVTHTFSLVPAWLERLGALLTFTRGKDGRLSRLRVDSGKGAYVHQNRDAGKALAAMDPRSLEHLTLGEGVGFLAETAKRFTGCEVVVE